MTFRVEVDGVVVPESVTAGATSHEEAALMVAPVSYAGKIITVETYIGEYLDRRWFEVVLPAEEGAAATVVEVHRTASGTVVPLRDRHD